MRRCFVLQQFYHPVLDMQSWPDMERMQSWALFNATGPRPSCLLCLHTWADGMHVQDFHCEHLHDACICLHVFDCAVAAWQLSFCSDWWIQTHPSHPWGKPLDSRPHASLLPSLNRLSSTLAPLWHFGILWPKQVVLDHFFSRRHHAGRRVEMQKSLMILTKKPWGESQNKCEKCTGKFCKSRLRPASSFPGSVQLAVFKSIYTMKWTVMWEAVEMGAADLISVKLLGPQGWGGLRLLVRLEVITS